MNRQPTVLETVALPVELRPSIPMTGTMDSRRDGVLPILFKPSSVSGQRPGGVLACRVLPGLAVAAAMRPNRGPAHSPCSRLHARPAGAIAGGRWWALTPPFHPLPAGLPAGLLSVAVVVTPQLLATRPHLLFREATLPACEQTGSREVPLRGRAAQRRILSLVTGIDS